jgi:hypothetical protein
LGKRSLKGGRGRELFDPDDGVGACSAPGQNKAGRSG